MTVDSETSLPPSFWETTESDPTESDASFWEAAGTEETVTEPSPADRTEQINPPANVCPTCGEEVVRRPGQRGRVAKYHPECKPGRGAQGEAVGGSPRAVRVSKTEQLAAEQTEMILFSLSAKLTKAAMLLALVDPYDALVLRVNTEELIANLRPVLMRYPKFRAILSGVDTGGSLFGLLLTVATTLLPIAAHHNMVPVKKAATFLLNLPFVMLRMQQTVAQNGEGLTESLFSQVMAEAKKQREEAQRRKTAEESPRGHFAKVP